MSVITNLDTPVPIITYDLFPSLHTLELVPIGVEYLDTSFYGLPPSQLNIAVDPKYVTGPQKYEHRYVNNNGIDIVLRGSYNDIMSALDVLNTYPPLKKDCDEETKYVDLTDTVKESEKRVGIMDYGKFINVKIDDKVFSGSGCVIMAIQKGKSISLNNSYFVLFRDAKTGQYHDAGGKIDKPKAGSPSLNIYYLKMQSRKFRKKV